MVRETPSRARTVIARAFSLVEDSVYVGLAILLAASSVALLVDTAIGFGGTVFSKELPERIVPILDRILLVLLIAELLYTVQVSFREHTVTPEPFLLVGLIAAIRRVLVLTAEFGHAGPGGSSPLVLELAVLSGLIVAIAISLYVLRKKGTVDEVAKP